MAAAARQAAGPVPEPVPIFSAASLQPTDRSRRESVAGPGQPRGGLAPTYASVRQGKSVV